MYHTSDGGKSWQRVGPALENSTIATIFFLDTKTGWAAGAWTTESAGDPFVLRTTDGGKTWAQTMVPVEPRLTPLFVPTSLVFATRKIGILRMSGCSAEDEQSVWVTRNGGKSWAFSCGQKDETGPCNALSITKDGTLWKLDEQDILVSTDNGSSWKKAETHPVRTERPRHRRCSP